MVKKRGTKGNNDELHWDCTSIRGGRKKHIAMMPCITPAQRKRKEEEGKKKKREIVGRGLHRRGERGTKTYLRCWEKKK